MPQQQPTRRKAAADEELESITEVLATRKHGELLEGGLLGSVPGGESQKGEKSSHKRSGEGG